MADGNINSIIPDSRVFDVGPSIIGRIRVYEFPSRKLVWYLWIGVCSIDEVSKKESLGSSHFSAVGRHRPPYGRVKSDDPGLATYSGKAFDGSRVSNAG